ncbi:hypothetical protein [Pleurocapsa sp. CCALA 161]|nr:hypothetical protein [Pleurocapsa sp. CCALA 161]
MRKNRPTVNNVFIYIVMNIQSERQFNVGKTENWWDYGQLLEEE